MPRSPPRLSIDRHDNQHARKSLSHPRSRHGREEHFAEPEQSAGVFDTLCVVFFHGAYRTVRRRHLVVLRRGLFATTDRLATTPSLLGRSQQCAVRFQAKVIRVLEIE